MSEKERQARRGGAYLHLDHIRWMVRDFTKDDRIAWLFEEQTWPYIKYGKRGDLPPLKGQSTNITVSKGQFTNITVSKGQSTNITVSKGQSTNITVSKGQSTNITVSKGQSTNITVWLLA